MMKAALSDVMAEYNESSLFEGNQEADNHYLNTIETRGGEQFDPQ